MAKFKIENGNAEDILIVSDNSYHERLEDDFDPVELVERSIHPWNFCDLLLRNALRHKLRSALTIFGVGVAVMAFALLQTVVSAWYAGVEASAANRLITRHAVSFVFPLPLAYRDRIAQVPGVNKVTYAAWFSGVYIDKNQFFARLAVDSETFFDVYPEFCRTQGPV